MKREIVTSRILRVSSSYRAMSTRNAVPASMPLKVR
jgi:hypothetical protein